MKMASVATGSSGNIESNVKFELIDHFKQDNDGDTFLHLYVVKENITDELAAMKISVLNHPVLKWNIKNNDGQTILLMAVVMDKPNTVKVLLEKGARTDLRYKHGETIYHIACKKGYARCLKELLKHDQEAATLESRNTANETALHVAIRNNRLDCAKILVGRKVDINASIPPSGTTCLIMAVEINSLEMVQLLLSSGANPDQSMTDGKTALHVAVGLDYRNIIAELSKSGGDLTKRSFQNTTPIGCSTSVKRRTELTRQHNAKKTKQRRLEVRNCKQEPQLVTSNSIYGNNTRMDVTLMAPPQSIPISSNQNERINIGDYLSHSSAATSTLGSLLGEVMMPDQPIQNEFLNSIPSNASITPKDLLNWIATKPLSENEILLRHQMLDQYYTMI